MLQVPKLRAWEDDPELFQWAPTLRGECYLIYWIDEARDYLFQWAPTLGGECYSIHRRHARTGRGGVSMGTHPWG